MRGMLNWIVAALFEKSQLLWVDGKTYCVESVRSESGGQSISSLSFGIENTCWHSQRFTIAAARWNLRRSDTGNKVLVKVPERVAKLIPMFRRNADFPILKEIMFADHHSAKFGLQLTRRDWLRSTGAAAFGWPLLPTLSGSKLSGQEVQEQPARRAKSIILIYLPGGLAQHDSFDLKPHAPVEIRGDFQSIATEVPGINVCEHLPLLAQRARQYALVRTMSHTENNHFPATHKELTGHVMPRQLPGDAVNAIVIHVFLLDHATSR